MLVFGGWRFGQQSFALGQTERRRGTYAANSEHREAFRLPRRAIEPLEDNCEPARDRRVVVAGIVTGCRWDGLKISRGDALGKSGQAKAQGRRSLGGDVGREPALVKGSFGCAGDGRVCCAQQNQSV